VQFASGQFTGSESSGFIEVVVEITGGTSNTPITVMVTPSEQSPVSAMGMYIKISYHTTKGFGSKTSVHGFRKYN